MSIVKQRLETALSVIHEDEKGFPFLSGKFGGLLAELHIRGIVLAQTKTNSAMKARVARVHKELGFAHQDFWDIQTIIYRISWQKNLWERKDLPNELWMQFAAVDIDLFHIVLRSLFDHLANVFRFVSNSPGEVKQHSFEKLRNWADKSEDHAQKLGQDITQLVVACEWFEDLREVRDSVVHRGGFTLVFPTEGRILFQVYQGWDKEVLVPEIMFNENVVDFEKYAGLYIGYLIAYLDETSALICKRLNLGYLTPSMSYHLGLPVIRDWIKKLLAT